MGMKPYRLLENKFQNINCSTDHIVLEIGSERGEGSSVWLHNWAKHRGMEFYSVDIDETAKQTVNNPDINFQVAESGSIWCKDVLPILNKKIKVLYLDNFDYIDDEWKDNLSPRIQKQINEYAARGVIMNNENSQHEHFLQIQYCLPYMDEESIVIVDDTYYDFLSDTWDGKCAKVMPFLAEHGYTIEGNPKYGKWACKKCSYFEGKKMRKLFYMGLEPYEGRYTLQLQQWNEDVFNRRGIDYVVVPGSTIDNTKAISVGQVLDAHGRSYFGMSQMMNLVQMMRSGECSGEDVIYFEDMFQPGIESLPYIMDQIPAEQRPRVYVRCLAQAIDPDDFVHVWGMAKWMDLYEKMVNEFATGVLATNEEMVAHMRIAGWSAPIYNISGLAFGKEEVLGRVNHQVKPWAERSNRIFFAARFDQEKQPDFYMDLIERVKSTDWGKDYEFAVFSGGPLRSNNQHYLDRAYRMEAEGKLKIYKDLQKNDYYNLVNDSKLIFNCALQDWVSNTVSEADALGANVLYPAYRSFPETFANDHERMYIPWSMDDAVNKLQKLMQAPHHNMGLISDWNNGTIDRICDIIEGKGEQWNRAGNRYRDHVAEAKYR